MTIKVNKQDWAGLSTSEQTQISSIISAHFNGETIEASDGGPVAADVGGICTTLCTMAETAATALCGRLSGTAQQVCVIAAQTAGDMCRARC